MVETKTTIVVKAKAKKNHRLTETELKAKYPHLIVGTLEWDDLNQKQRATCKCACGKEFHAFTSDLFQLKACPECRAMAKKEKRKTGTGRSAITQEQLDKMTPEDKATLVRLGLAEEIKVEVEAEITEEQAIPTVG